jgi:hypothetical protein
VRGLPVDARIGGLERDPQGGLAAADRGAVHDVVVHEHEEVEHLDARGEPLDLVALARAAAREAAEEHELRAEQVLGSLVDREGRAHGYVPHGRRAVAAQRADGAGGGPIDARERVLHLFACVPGDHRRRLRR